MMAVVARIPLEAVDVAGAYLFAIPQHGMLIGLQWL